jgi:hypothetical protein
MQENVERISSGADVPSALECGTNDLGRRDLA